MFFDEWLPYVASTRVPRSPLFVVKDGDRLATMHSMLCLRGFDTVKVDKVKGHAIPWFRLEDLVGNNGADAASDLETIKTAG